MRYHVKFGSTASKCVRRNDQIRQEYGICASVVFLWVSHAHTARGRAPALPNFGVFLMFMRVNSHGLFLAGQPRPPSQGSVDQVELSFADSQLLMRTRLEQNNQIRLGNTHGEGYF